MKSVLTTLKDGAGDADDAEGGGERLHERLSNKVVASRKRGMIDFATCTLRP
jgi:hypothetical protein